MVRRISDVMPTGNAADQIQVVRKGRKGEFYIFSLSEQGANQLRCGKCACVCLRVYVCAYVCMLEGSLGPLYFHFYIYRYSLRGVLPILQSVIRLTICVKKKKVLTHVSYLLKRLCLLPVSKICNFSIFYNCITVFVI